MAKKAAKRGFPSGSGTLTEPMGKPPMTDDQEFRKWCIETAMTWPQQYAGLPGQYPGGAVIESDVIGKAGKIRRWVLNPDSAGEK